MPKVQNLEKEIARLEVCCKVKDEELDAVRAKLEETEAALQKRWHAWEDDIKRLREELTLTTMRNSALQDLFVRLQRSLSRGTIAGKLEAQFQAMLQTVDWHGTEADIIREAIQKLEKLDETRARPPRLPNPDNMHGACDGFGGSDFDET